jgi:3-oxoacyl-[acyl-carrier-protein] synthase II
VAYPYRRDPVAVVGAGVKTPVGNRIDELWDALCAGRSSAVVFSDNRLPEGAGMLVSEVTGFDPADYLSPVENRRLDRTHALALAAAEDALDQCNHRLPEPERRAVVCGVGLGAAATYEEQHSRLAAGGLRALSPLTIPVVMPSSVSAHLSLRHDFRGPCLTVAAACASGAAAVGEAVELLRRGAADVVLAGGVDSLVSYAAMCAFSKLDVMSRNVSSPELASRPFDKDRDGFVMAEGAGFLVLQRLPDAVAADRDVLGVVVGHASCADAHHLVAPSPDGAGPGRCMRLALADAEITASEVGHINAHGTSTLLNDASEAAAVAALFGDRSLPVTAVKGSTGHMIGGSGAVEAIVTMASLRRGLVPPVAGLRTIDPTITVDVVMTEPRPVAPGYGLSNSFGFGGVDTSLVLAAPGPFTR